jgi:xylulose-5-phosphate/fructose-6-phosphate phosphoketolase
MRGQHCTCRYRHLALGGNETPNGGEPDVVMACCGDVPTLETLAAVAHAE